MLHETVFMEWRDSTMLSRFRCPALVALLAIALPAVSWAAAPAPLKVMSFNVRTPADTEPGKRWPDRRDAMVKVILDAHPAVIGTQELVQEQADYLVQHLPGYRWFGEGRRGGNGDEHMGVFYDSTRLSVESSGDFWLSDTPEVAGSITWGNLYPRMVTWAVFRRLDDGRRFYFMNTHLPYRDEDEPRRVKGAELIATRLATLPPDLPVVLTGDFNSEPGGETYKAFTRVLQDTRTQVAAPQGPRLTFHDFTGTPTVQLDWVLVRGFHARSFLTDDRRIKGVLPSDHFPLVVELDWPKR
jgi:endonuclease/exonuclease/phosphatase family metal-dependent hydrolase